MKRIAVLTSGGDCSGMNPAVRAVVRSALSIELTVFGVQKGFQGVIDRLYQNMASSSVSNIIQRGGTVLQTARCQAMHTEAGQNLAAANLQGLQIDGLIVIGGGGSLRGAHALAQKGIRVVGIPASIDNDIPHTDMSLGVDTALNNIIYAVDCLKDTASSHDRAFVVEAMGRDCGYLTLAAAIACGAEFALIPEAHYDIGHICDALKRRYREGRSNSIIMVAEGAAHAHEIASQITDQVGYETRIMVLGHYQRGGTPTTFDRLLGSRMGVAAVEALRGGASDQMMALNTGKITQVPLQEVIDAGIRPIDQSTLNLASKLGI